ncbi:MAG: hypothetical protein REI94_14970 [Moraxellaceae bacterium]|nr:hypothetical protein [Moraxellaceae bacterium]
MNPATEPTAARSARRWRNRFWLLVALLVTVPALVLLIAAIRFLPDRPVTYDDPAEHFKYGSTGGERESGFPYWIWQVLPTVCAKHLPGKGYESLGMIFEPGKTLPVGVSQRRNLGLDRVFLNCAACHVSTVRASDTAEPKLYVGMPSHRLDLYAFERFFFNCAADPKFAAEYLVPEIDRAAGGIGPIDRYLVYPVAISLMRERLLMLKGRFSFVAESPPWGPGRVDTFNSAKALFAFPFERLPVEEKRGASDFPSVWLQAARKQRDDGAPMQLHWDGNNDRVEERNRSAAFGTGTTPPTIDMTAIGRIEDWLLTLPPPDYPFPRDAALAARGKPVYDRLCADCHGASGRDFKGKLVGHITPIADITTDRARLDSYTYELAVNQATLYAGYDAASREPRFERFRKTWGYANMPLDGLWLRAPYLHNGSVPTLRDLLEPVEKRPKQFHRGNDVYDPQRVGFVSNVAEANGHRFFPYDTTQAGNGNGGHSGAAYGTDLPAADKDALVEYLKGF